MISSNKGFTLVELIVVMVVFIVVIMITGQAFETILKHTGRLTKSEESNIEGIAGLEMFRHDLQQAGFGLPDSFLSSTLPPKYAESASTPASLYNDATTTTGIPRALVFDDNITATYSNKDANNETFTILNGTDYIGVKGTTLGAAAPATNTNQKWTYVTSTNTTPHLWPSENLTTNDRVIVIKRSFTDSTYVNQLIYDTSDQSTYWTKYSTAGLTGEFAPTLATDIYYIYGITNAQTGLRMPFNRSDFFVANSSTSAHVPTVCSPSTGTLYKGVVRHSDGNMDYIPLLDCVADMQVVLGWDLTDASGSAGQDGVVETYTNATGTTASGTSSLVTSALADPATLRNSLKVVKVYILAQIGRTDPNYTGPASMVVGQNTERALTKTFYFTDTMRHFHWKLYQLIVRPQNLLSNQ
jgi:prepilin-type N-terminal cleavage/methylation domain-containing protein